MLDEMVSEKAIEWLWILMSAGVVIFGLLMMFAGGGFFGFITAILYIAIGLLVVRILCESMVVAFKMFENSRRSLTIMEQMGKDQAASRQAIQALLKQSTTSSITNASADAALTPALARQQAAPSDSNDNRVSTVHEQLREEVRFNKSKPKSMLGDWPGGSAVR